MDDRARDRGARSATALKTEVATAKLEEREPRQPHQAYEDAARAALGWIENALELVKAHGRAFETTGPRDWAAIAALDELGATLALCVHRFARLEAHGLGLREGGPIRIEGNYFIPAVDPVATPISRPDDPIGNVGESGVAAGGAS